MTATATKAKPILFSAPMVRAILDGRKTQTRRIIKPQPDWIRPSCGGTDVWHGYCGSGPENGVRCHYGTVGSELWVRETWQHGPDDSVWYKATDEDIVGGCYKRMWKPSIHMPRVASRITLRITGIRVERVQDITEEDAKAEGVEPNWIGDLSGWNADEHGWIHYTRGIENFPAFTAKESFQSLWEKINGPESWAANPWVWVVSFERAGQ